ncbi:Hypothetical protein CINCED_3A020854 [Cinara cedri]|uniref:Uncharacterized protein n=1 Tax=Cinara cedri TaxID=506608 RepID=A0A5E4ND15_9HEMI|nr:Hypothetical protein CINCED_3A020854 [Cinara cedri]
MGMSKRTALLYGAIVTFGLGTLYLGLTMKSSRPPKDPNSWDIIIFTQTWPQTLCYEWKGKNPNHTCNFPKQKDLWTVHGLWPTKLGTIGPMFCNKSIPFDPKSLYGIEKKLHEYWIDIELNNNETEENISNNSISHKKESIWFHEWEKHGTCAITLPALNSEFKYFYQGIEWSEKYNMKDTLEKGGIKVNDTTSFVTDYWKALKTVLKTNAWIECVFKSDTKQQMLFEIRICFDKSLKMINCNGIMFEDEAKTSKHHSLTNCDLKKPILYLDNVPIQNSSFNSSSIDDNKDWDLLIFSQSWPYTFCHTWTVDSKTHTCNLPVNRNQWTIHGIWPSKTGSFGPSFCNNQTSFSLDALKTIIPELKNHWTEIKGSKSTSSKSHEGGLWRYEWLKHGTCAKSLPALDTELKFFKQALDWSKQYPLNDILAQGEIKPNGTYPIAQFWHTLKTGLGKNPYIDCFVEKNSNNVYIDEIRVCFNKTLSLVDCDTLRGRNKDKPYTNCPMDRDIHYIGAEF